MSGHFVPVVAFHNNHRILTHQIAGCELIAAIVAGNIACKVAVRLLERATIGKFIQVDRGALQEGALLRETRQGVERNRHPFGIRFECIAREHSVLAVFSILTVFAVLTGLTFGSVQHHADAVAVAHNLETRAVLEFFRLAGIVTVNAIQRNPVSVNADSDGRFILDNDLFVLVIFRAFGKVFCGGNDLHAGLIYVFDGIAAGR